MHAKKKGTRNEHKSMARRTTEGAYCIRAGGSLGIWDYIALYSDHVALVQVKSNRWPGRDEIQAISTFRAPHYGRKIIERWDDYAREPLVREVE